LNIFFLASINGIVHFHNSKYQDSPQLLPPISKLLLDTCRTLGLSFFKCSKSADLYVPIFQYD
jgi:hypothetical protein